MPSRVGWSVNSCKAPPIMVSRGLCLEAVACNLHPEHQMLQTGKEVSFPFLELAHQQSSRAGESQQHLRQLPKLGRLPWQQGAPLCRKRVAVVTRSATLAAEGGALGLLWRCSFAAEDQEGPLTSEKPRTSDSSRGCRLSLARKSTTDSSPLRTG
ncbi:hypothetical protein lerEdw1_006407 [Lerista edwardsae]|nr:hypothetical protein lerEdw1_006407 [Lerista edwardsae]